MECIDVKTIKDHFIDWAGDRDINDGYHPIGFRFCPLDELQQSLYTRAR
jgi:hypothetical protein